MFRKKYKDAPELDEKKLQELYETFKANDKLQHITANWAFVTVAFYGLSGYVGEVYALGTGFVAALAFSIFKEITDEKLSVKDLKADFFGIGVGLLTVALSLL